MPHGEDFGPFGEWPDEWRETFDDIPGIGLFREYEQDVAMDLFEAGFMHHSDEPGYDADYAQAMRDEFFEFTGLPEEMFPWDEWREAMGYDD
jgi:hypothetical protein